MTDTTQELSEIIRAMRYRVLEDNGLTVNGLTTIEQETKQAIIDWHNKQVEELLDRLTVADNISDRACSEAIEAERAKLKEVK